MRFVWVLVLILAGLVGAGLYTRLEREAPVIRTRVEPTFVGRTHTHEFRAIDDGMGVERLEIWIETNGDRVELFNEAYAGSLLMGAELKIPRRAEVTFQPADLGVSEGQALLVAEAADFSWLGNRARIEVPLLIDTKPPRVSLQTGLTYVRRGGSELVVYSLSEEVPRHGVKLGDVFSPGFPHPAEDGRMLAFYPFPPDAGPGTAPDVLAEDRAGNAGRARVAISVVERSFPDDTINLSQGFLAGKVPELLGEEPADLLEGYLKINRDMRAENAETIRRICEESSAERLWRGAFLQLPNSNVGAKFGEKRKYVYEGREVDRQVHLGYDLASTARSPIPAANAGVVVYADDLGIYGQTVIIDHGLGLFSLYGHLSEIGVEKGAVVVQGETIGKTGTTGLAGGDHLHFSMIVAGVFVDPLEWFDPRWIEEHVEAKLAAGKADS